MKALENLARLCAILAGLLLTVITLMTCTSLIGRNFLGTTLVGDFDVVGGVEQDVGGLEVVVDNRRRLAVQIQQSVQHLTF